MDWVNRQETTSRTTADLHIRGDYLIVTNNKMLTKLNTHPEKYVMMRCLAFCGLKLTERTLHITLKCLCTIQLAMTTGAFYTPKLMAVYFYCFFLKKTSPCRMKSRWNNLDHLQEACCLTSVRCGVGLKPHMLQTWAWHWVQWL